MMSPSSLMFHSYVSLKFIIGLDWVIQFFDFVFKLWNSIFHIIL